MFGERENITCISNEQRPQAAGVGRMGELTLPLARFQWSRSRTNCAL